MRPPAAVNSFAAIARAASLARMSLFSQIDSDIKDAMRARAAERLGVLRMLKSTLKATAAEKGIADEALDDATALAVIRKEMKKRQDSIESFEKGARQDLADKEKSEAAILAGYLPQPLTAGEMEALVKAAIAESGATSKAQMGAVMKLATERAAGRADGRAVSATVGRLLP
jgi:hypothetical protein